MKLAEGSRVVTLARAPHEEGVATQEVEDDGTAEEGTDDLPEDMAEAEAPAADGIDGEQE